MTVGRAIHKFTVPPESPLGKHSVPGIPRTIGIQGSSLVGALALIALWAQQQRRTT